MCFCLIYLTLLHIVMKSSIPKNNLVNRKTKVRERMKSLYILTLLAVSSCSYAIEPLQNNIELKSNEIRSTMLSMADEELSEVQGQALYSLNRQEQDGLSFYTLSMEADIALNANIKNLQVGCGGVNSSATGKGGMCDLDIQDFSFGCIASSSGQCITLPKSDPRQANGVIQEVTLGDKPQSQMKDFNLKNPFFQFAIKDANKASTREIMGIRIGAAQAEGPLSFGHLNTFSGYFTGKANLAMLGETDVSPVRYADARYQDASAFLGLDNAQILGIPLIAYVDYRDLTADYGTVTRNNLGVSVVGNRVTQAQIQGVQLGSVVDEIVGGLSVNRSCIRIFGLICGGSLGTALANGLLPLLQGGIGDYIKGELAEGLGTTTSELNAYQIPYNLKNVHQVDVNSNTFGIALSKQAIKYPGYVQAVPIGWSMYLQDAFTLDIKDKVSNLVQNIASSPNARNGDITLLAVPYRNCYGNLKFC